MSKLISLLGAFLFVGTDFVMTFAWRCIPTHSLRERVPASLGLLAIALLLLVALPCQIGRLATLGVHQTSVTVH